MPRLIEPLCHDKAGTRQRGAYSIFFYLGEMTPHTHSRRGKDVLSRTCTDYKLHNIPSCRNIERAFLLGPRLSHQWTPPPSLEFTDWRPCELRAWGPPLLSLYLKATNLSSPSSGPGLECCSSPSFGPAREEERHTAISAFLFPAALPRCISVAA